MLSISKSLSAGQARTYHAREFASEKQNYWSRDQQGHSEWQGRLASEWGLQGPVGSEQFARLSEGQHPETEAQLVRHSVSKTYEGKNGKEITTVEHRAGWDATFSAPKSVSLTALVGGDDRVREAHRDSVRVALGELERYTEARIGNVKQPEHTGKFVAATFEHDTARPVEGYAAPQLHTHAVIFNVTERESGQTRALQPHQLFASQTYATQVYRNELAVRLKELGYTIERGEYGQPEIKGYTREYMEASSPRREQVKDHLRAEGLEGPAAAQVAAHRTRDSKEQLPAEEVQRQHKELAAKHGNQADRVVAEALGRKQEHASDQAQTHEPAARRGLVYARDHIFERTAVDSERSILTAAMGRSMGEATHAQVRQEFQRRVATGEFRAVESGSKHEGQQYTTAETLRMEREVLAHTRLHCEHLGPKGDLVWWQTAESVTARHPELNQGQRQAVEQIFRSRNQIVGLDGLAGVGKTTTLAVVREGAEAHGYSVEGFAPTSKAAKELSKAGIETKTLQAHLARGQRADTGERRLFVLDEASLTSTRQMHQFVSRLHPNDRVLLVGDTRQHESVEAGRIFAQMQEGGMRTTHLDRIVRQKDPQLRHVVEQLAKGDVGGAVLSLDQQGRVHAQPDQEKRFQAIAKEYARAPEGTLVVSPDNRSRVEINNHIRAELQEQRKIDRNEHQVRTLVPRQDLTGAARTWASRYQEGDVLRYSRGSKETGIVRGEYATVVGVDAAHNQITVALADQRQQTYDPRRHQGVSIYRTEERAFSKGDRVQFTAPDAKRGVVNREMGTVDGFASDQIRLKMDSGRTVQLDSKGPAHLDHGYAVTSHSSQGQTAERVLINVDTEHAAKDLLNNRMAYVSISRGANDSQIFTNDRATLGTALGRDVSHRHAYTRCEEHSHASEVSHKPAPTLEKSYEQGMQLGF